VHGGESIPGIVNDIVSGFKIRPNRLGEFLMVFH
jgi:hypothetical protein